MNQLTNKTISRTALASLGLLTRQPASRSLTALFDSGGRKSHPPFEMSYNFLMPGIFAWMPVSVSWLQGSFSWVLGRLAWKLKSIFSTTRRYGPLRGPTSSSCGGLRPRLFLPFGQKRAYYAVLAHFWHFLVSSSNLGNF